MKYKNCIVTGAGAGMGRSIAIELSKHGVNTFLCARNKQRLEETAQICRQNGVKSIAYPVDLTDISCFPELKAAALEALSDIDCLINCAGICPNDGIDNITPEEWDSVMNINLRGSFFLTQAILPIMKEKKFGYIININSTVALGAKPSVAVYSASKYGLAGITTALYEDCKQFNIRVSSIYPGVTDTEMLRNQEPFCDPSLWMLPEDIVHCVMFLLQSSTRMVVKDIVPWASAYDKI